MGIVGQLNQVAANTQFEAMANDIFSRRGDSAWTVFTKSVNISGQSLELDAIGPSPAVRKLIGSRRFSSLRSYAKSTPSVEYSADGIELERNVVLNDKSGNVTARLSDYLGSTSDFLEKPVIDLYLSNPTCIDGSALFSTTHPYGNAGATWSNKTTGSLTQSELEAANVAMRSFRFENGEPAGFRPTHLVVGPALEREAKDLTGSMRMMPIDTSGTPDATSLVNAATMIQNWIGGQLTVMVIDRFADGTHDTDWAVMDLSKPNVRPIVAGVAIAPSGVVVDSPTSDAMIQRAVFQYYVHANAALSGYAPQTVFGKMS